MGIHLMNDVFSNTTITESFSLKYLCYQFWIDVGDPRVDNYLLVKYGPSLTLAIIGIYLIFSIYLGPRLMKNRNALRLRRLILAYNILMVLLNLKYLLFVVKYLNYGIDLFIQKIPKRSDTSPLILYQIDQMHQLFITKFIDLFDTIFFVLRKKQNHVSVLHLYHHSLVPILYWAAFRIVPTFKPLGIFVIINCFIHVLMYSYYALSSFGPKIQRFLWWKKYITQIQMIQFVIYAIYAVYCSIVIDGFPLYLQLIVHIQSPVFLVLFGHFYVKAYNKNKNKVDDKNNNQNNNQNLIYKNDTQNAIKSKTC